MKKETIEVDSGADNGPLLCMGTIWDIDKQKCFMLHGTSVVLSS